jgi:hypothetical protein
LPFPHTSLDQSDGANYLDITFRYREKFFDILKKVASENVDVSTDQSNSDSIDLPDTGISNSMASSLSEGFNPGSIIGLHAPHNLCNLKLVIHVCIRIVRVSEHFSNMLVLSGVNGYLIQ